MKTLAATVIGFAIGLVAHFGFITWRVHAVRAAWADTPALSLANVFEKYFVDSEYIIGISIAAHSLLRRSFCNEPCFKRK